MGPCQNLPRDHQRRGSLRLLIQSQYCFNAYVSPGENSGELPCTGWSRQLLNQSTKLSASPRFKLTMTPIGPPQLLASEWIKVLQGKFLFCLALVATLMSS
jgi:hypothetical protein